MVCKDKTRDIHVSIDWVTLTFPLSLLAHYPSVGICDPLRMNVKDW